MNTIYFVDNILSNLNFDLNILCMFENQIIIYTAKDGLKDIYRIKSISQFVSANKTVQLVVNLQNVIDDNAVAIAKLLKQIED